jgi:transposase
VITVEDWVSIKNLKSRRPDLGSRKIAKLLGVGRNTVKRALASESAPRYNRSAKINPDIKPFADYIYQQLVVRKLRGSRVLNDIRSKGYRGSQSAFYRHMAKIRHSEHKTFEPYETGPGEQGQFDWTSYTVLIAGELTKVIVFGYVLGFSRHLIFEGSLSETQGCVLEALENSFHETGGVPQRVQTDNARVFVKNPSKEAFKWNERYLQFCGHHGIRPTRSLPGHPWSKGKVERPFAYLEDHFIQGNSFDDFGDFIKRLKEFQEQVNSRIHQTTRMSPKQLLERESSCLMALPRDRYVNIKEQVRKATADCLISFEGNRYSVPWPFACREVWVRVSKGYYLEVYSSQNAIIATHILATTKGNVIINKAHYKNHKIERGNWDRLSQLFLQHFDQHDWFLDKLKTQKRINPGYHLTRIMDMTQFFQREDMMQAFNACRAYNVFNWVFVKGFLEQNAKIQFSLQVDTTRTTDTVSELSRHSIKRPLAEYQLHLLEDISAGKEVGS